MRALNSFIRLIAVQQMYIMKRAKELFVSGGNKNFAKIRFRCVRSVWPLDYICSVLKVAGRWGCKLRSSLVLFFMTPPPFGLKDGPYKWPIAELIILVSRTSSESWLSTYGEAPV